MNQYSSFSSWTVQHSHIDVLFLSHSKFHTTHFLSCSVRFMSITAFDFIDKLLQDNSLQLQSFSFNQLIVLTAKFCLFLFSHSWSVDHSLHDCESLHTQTQASRLNFHFSLSPHFHIQPFCAAVCCGSSQPNFNSQFFIVDDFASPFCIFCEFLQFNQFEFFFNFNSGRFIWIRFALLQLDIHSLPTWTWSHFGQTILFCWHSIWRLIGQLTMQGPGFGLDNHPNPLPPPAIPPPRTPPCPPGLSRLGNSTVEQVTAKAWRWCNKTTETFFKLLLLPAHWGDLLCSTTPAVTIPQWLETGGSARASCQHLFRSVSSMDFQLHYLSCQVVDNFRWIHSQLQKITDGCYEVTHRLAQVEILVFNLDALLEGIQEQLRWMPQKGVLPKSQPKAKAQRPRPSSVLPQQRNTFKRWVQKSFLKKVRTHESRLQSVESSFVNIEKTLRRNKQLSKKVQELEDQLEKQSTRLARLMKAARNTERCLRENGLLRDDQRLSQSSESELE